MTKELDIELELTERQQLLLSRYCDGECGCVERLLAKRLLARSGDAKTFLRDMESVRDCCRTTLTRPAENFESTAAQTADMWERISTRIEQETRAELYLGKRRLEQPKESLWARLMSPYTLAGSVSGAALAGALLFVVYRPTSVLTFSAPQSSAINSGNFVQQVSLGGINHASVRPGSSSLSPLRVDWLRSRGSLSFIPAQDGHNAIIWVRRHQRPLQKPAVRAVRQRTLGAAPPIVTIPADPSVTLKPSFNKGWLDEPSVAGTK